MKSRSAIILSLTIFCLWQVKAANAEEDMQDRASGTSAVPATMQGGDAEPAGGALRISKIEIKGNRKVREQLIVNNLALQSGVLYAADLVRESERRLRNTGFFADVQSNTRAGEVPGETVLTFLVQEQPTFFVWLWPRYNYYDYLSLDFQIGDSNFMDTGDAVGLWLGVGSLRQYEKIWFYNPGLFDGPASLQFDFSNFEVRTAYGEWVPYKPFNSWKGAAALGCPVHPHWKVYLKYAWRKTTYEFEGIAAGYFGNNPTVASSITPMIECDSRDNIFEPKQGFYQRLAVELAGGPLGGDCDFAKYSAESRVYVPLGADWIFTVLVDAGYVYDEKLAWSEFWTPDVRYGTEMENSGAVFPRYPFEGRLADSGNIQWQSQIAADRHFTKNFQAGIFVNACNVWEGISQLSKEAFLNPLAGARLTYHIPNTLYLLKFQVGAYPIHKKGHNQPGVFFYLNFENNVLENQLRVGNPGK